MVKKLSRGRNASFRGVKGGESGRNLSRGDEKGAGIAPAKRGQFPMRKELKRCAEAMNQDSAQRGTQVFDSLVDAV